MKKGYKIIQFTIDDETYERVTKVKKRRTWVELLKEEVLKEKID